MQLTVEKLSKRYGRTVQALRDVDLTLGPGVLGLLGPNGAGKSTLMRILATVTRPSSGRVLWNNGDIARNPDALRDVLGYLPQDFGVYPNLNALEFLEYLAAVKGITAGAARQRIGELLELVNLTDAAKRPLGGYSGGMRQRVGIAQALLNDPQLLIVDEPTAGLDPEERVRFRNLLVGAFRRAHCDSFDAHRVGRGSGCDRALRSLRMGSFWRTARRRRCSRPLPGACGKSCCRARNCRRFGRITWSAARRTAATAFTPGS